jgi:glycosyltransferase involved in cell wall biosynthesis
VRSVVMIAHFFPPEGTAGTHRSLRFLRGLCKNGWHATVICSDPYKYERYDPGLSDLVPKEARVIRVRGTDLWHAIQAWRATRIQEMLGRSSWEWPHYNIPAHHSPFRSRLRELVRIAEAWYYRPDMAMPWIRPAVKKTVAVCKSDRPDVIWATIGPVSSGVVAYRASLSTGVPYVLDFRDPWGLNYFDSEARRPSWAKYLDERILYRILKHARAAVFLFESVAWHYWRFFNGALDASRIHIIPNGYDGTIEEFSPPKGVKCTILYTGTVSSYCYDTLLQSLHWLKRFDSDRARHLRLLFVGEGTEVLANDVRAHHLSDIVETEGPRSQAQITCLQREAHAVLVLGRPLTRKGYELFAGAKLFGYLQAGKPIIGVLPPDETKRILHHIGVPTVADVDSVSEIVTVLRQVLDAWAEGKLSSLAPDRKACEAYSSEKQTTALVRALEGVPPEEPFVPGSVEIPRSLRGTIVVNGWLD